MFFDTNLAKQEVIKGGINVFAQLDAPKRRGMEVCSKAWEPY